MDSLDEQIAKAQAAYFAAEKGYDETFSEMEKLGDKLTTFAVDRVRAKVELHKLRLMKETQNGKV